MPPKHPSQATIARELGLTPGRVSQLVDKGMPIFSVDAARRWRAQHVAPVASSKPAPRSSGKHTANAPDGAGQYDELALRQATALIAITCRQLESGHMIDLDLVPTIRGALSAVPVPLREQIAMPVELWDLLCEAVREQLQPAEFDQAQDLPDGDRLSGQAMYAIASGEIRPT